MSREQKMLAVVEAARGFVGEKWITGSAIEALRTALAALDAHTEAQEVVTLAVWTSPQFGTAFLAVPGTMADECPERHFYERRTVTLPLTPEGGR